MMTIVTMMTKMIMKTIFINDNHDDHVHPNLHPGFEPLDDHDNHIFLILFPGYDSGEDHDDHDNHDE